MIHGDLSHLTASFDGIEPSIMARMNIVQPSYIHIYIWNINFKKSLVGCNFNSFIGGLRVWNLMISSWRGLSLWLWGIKNGILKIPKHQSKTLLTAWLGATHTIKGIKHQNDNILWIPSSKLTACHGKRMNLAHLRMIFCTYLYLLQMANCSNMFQCYVKLPEGNSFRVNCCFSPLAGPNDPQVTAEEREEASLADFGRLMAPWKSWEKKIKRQE